MMITAADYTAGNLWLILTIPCVVLLGILCPVIVDLCLHVLFGGQPARVKAVMQQISALREQQSRVNMVDEFATHSRIQRKINALQGTCRLYESEQKVEKLKYRLVAICVIYLVKFIVMMSILYRYSGVPVIRLPATALFPVSWLLAYPRCEMGGVSVTAWTVMCVVVLKRGANALPRRFRPVSQ